MRSTLSTLLALAVLSLCLVSTAGAAVNGHAEPAFTKTSGNNAYWWQWTRVAGVADNQNPDSNRNGVNDGSEYYLCFRTERNGVTMESSNGTNGPNSTNCTNYFTPLTQQTGNYGAAPFQATTVLDDGATYTLCATDYRRSALIWQSASSSCPFTTIDRNAPALGVTLANGANLTNNATIPASISYNDATSPPWNGSNGYASNWVCIQQGSTCTPAGNPDLNCSVPNAGFGSRINSFNCGLNIGGGDGTYHFCARGADAAVPDNPSGPNQFQNAFSNNANLSSTACDSVVLDRAAPSVNVTASATTVTVGELVNFSAAVSDPNGLSGGVSWSFGDNTPQGGGQSTSHTYTQAGTFVVRASQNDAAGNRGEGTVTITVNPTSSGNTGNTGNTGNVTPGTQQGTTGVNTVSGETTQSQLTQQVQQQAGGGEAATVDVGGLDVVAPKRFTAGRRTLLLALTAEAAGRVDAAFLRGSRVIGRKGAALGGPGTYTLNLPVPRKLKPGSYKLKVTFRPAGAAAATTKTLTVRVTRKRRPSRRNRPAARELHGTPASRSRKPKAVDPASVDRTIEVG